MIINNPNFLEKAREIFAKANFVTDMGVELVEIDEGYAETCLKVESKHLQQDGYVHAGVQSTIADHTAGVASVTLVGENETILSVEFKINLLRPAIGEYIICRSNILKQGRTLIIVESEVFSKSEDKEKLVSKATITLAVVKNIV